MSALEIFGFTRNSLIRSTVLSSVTFGAFRGPSTVIICATRDALELQVVVQIRLASMDMNRPNDEVEKIDLGFRV